MSVHYWETCMVHGKYVILIYYFLVLTIIPANSTQPSPSAQQLTIFSSLTCEIQAEFQLSTTTVESSWTLPNGTIIRIHDESDRYFVSQGSSDGEYLTILLIQPTIYSDANTYTCEVRDIRDPDNRGPWLPAQATLKLLGKHLNVKCSSIYLHYLLIIYSGIDCQ